MDPEMVQANRSRINRRGSPKLPGNVACPRRRKVVLGLGDFLHRDEGFGVHAMMELRARLEAWARVEWVDGGAPGANLLPLIDQCSHLLVLNAIGASFPPGKIIELRKEEIAAFTLGKLPEHQIGIQDVSGLFQVRDKLPAYLHVLGVQPIDLSSGVQLSPAVHYAIPAVIERATEILIEWKLVSRTGSKKAFQAPGYATP